MITGIIEDYMRDTTEAIIDDTKVIEVTVDSIR